MLAIHPKYVRDEERNCDSVVLPVSEWEKIMDALEELDDIRAYDAAQPHVKDRLPLEQAIREIEQEYQA